VGGVSAQPREFAQTDFQMRSRDLSLLHQAGLSDVFNQLAESRQIIEAAKQRRQSLKQRCKKNSDRFYEEGILRLEQGGRFP